LYLGFAHAYIEYIQDGVMMLVFLDSIVIVDAEEINGKLEI
jgi:hypothetical protein